MRNLAKKEGLKETLKCACCGEIIESDIFNTCDGEVCEECYNTEYVECYECGVAYNLNEVIYVDNVHMCEDCYNDNYRECECCGEATRYDFLQSTRDDYILCNTCFNEETIICAGCGSVIYRDYEIVEHPIQDRYYCGDCYESGNCYDLENQILPYSFKKMQNELNFWKLRNECGLMLGIEYEVIANWKYDPYDILRAVREYINSDYLIFKEDGSLGSQGVEMVMDPITIKYLKEYLDFNTVIENIEYMLNEDEMKEKAGIHIHLSKKLVSKNDIVKIINFLYHIEKYITGFINRTDRQKAEWCEFPSNLYKSYPDAEANYFYRRYRALNIMPKHTVEFRLFGATEKFEDLINYMKFVEYTYLYIKQVSNNFLVNNNSSIVWKEFLNFIKKYDIKFYELLRKSKPVKVYTGKFGVYLNNTCDSDAYNNNHSTIAVEDEFLNNNNTSSYSTEYEEAREEL